jgi:diguanylate cyclase (GGDEF)-like protein/PAS domain S-box-containing protein
MLTFSFFTNQPGIFLLVHALLLVGILFLFMAAAAWRYRHNRAAFTFILLMLAMSFYALGYFFELNSSSITEAFFWLRFQYLGIAVLPSLWLLFVLQYTDRQSWLKAGTMAVIFATSAITLPLVFTNNLHNLFYKSMTLLNADYITILSTEKGPWYWVHITYFVVTFFLANYFLLEAALQSRDYFKRRFMLLFIASLFPWVAFVVYISGQSPMNLDLIPFGMIFTGVIVLYDLLHYRLFDILPIARANVFDAIQEGIVVLDSFERIVDLNEASTHIYGFDKDFIGQHISTLTQLFSEECKQAPQSGMDTRVCTYDSVGGSKWLEVRTSPLKHGTGEGKGRLLIIRDITDQKLAENALRESEALQSSIVAAIPDTLIRINGEGLILDILTMDENRLSLPCTEGVGKTVEEVMPGNLAERFMDGIKDALQTKTLQTLEYELGTPAGTLDYEARIMAYAENEVVSMVRDITDEKRYQEKLEYLSLHDSLTGLFNRAFFEAEIERLFHSREYPITIMSADLDGLKLINDTMGHDRGDSLLKTCARVVKESLRRSDVLARVGGDEFAVILPRTNFNTGAEVARRIQDHIKAYNEGDPPLPLSLSVGIATAGKKGAPLEETYKIADDLMYRNKLSGSAATRSKIINSLLASLAEKDFLLGENTKDLAKLSQDLGRKAGLSSRQLKDLDILINVRNLGKIGIPDHVLSKQGRLTKSEQDLLNQHPEKGFRIASSYPDLAGIAHLIQKHHERWDGKGYPLGIEGEEIPIECRIMAIVETYLTLTDSLSPGDKTKEEAVKELQKSGGRQFDPALVALFLDMLAEPLRQQ